MMASQFLAWTSRLPPRPAVGTPARSPARDHASRGLTLSIRAPASTSMVNAGLAATRYSPAIVHALPLSFRSRSAVTGEGGMLFVIWKAREADFGALVSPYK